MCRSDKTNLICLHVCCKCFRIEEPRRLELVTSWEQNMWWSKASSVQNQAILCLLTEWPVCRRPAVSLSGHALADLRPLFREDPGKPDIMAQKCASTGPVLKMFTRYPALTVFVAGGSSRPHAGSMLGNRWLVIDSAPGLISGKWAY